MLESTIVAPIASRSSGPTAFTVACVPTGMKTGVGIAPCGVVTMPARACVCSQRAEISKRSGWPGVSGEEEVSMIGDIERFRGETRLTGQRGRAQCITRVVAERCRTRALLVSVQFFNSPTRRPSTSAPTTTRTWPRAASRPAMASMIVWLTECDKVSIDGGSIWIANANLM